MKICFLSYEYPKETGFGGIGMYTYYSARALHDLGHEVWVISGAVSPKHELREIDGIKVMRSKLNGHDSYLTRMRQRLGRRQSFYFLNRLETGYTMYRCYEELKLTNEFDVIEMPENGGEGFFLNRHTNGERKIVKLHSPMFLTAPYYSMENYDAESAEKIDLAALKYADTIVASSQYVADEVKKHISLEKDIYVVPNGIDLKAVENTPELNVRSKYNISPEKEIIFFSGHTVL